ncbi:2,3-bisphosphoglycerate-independent phosphoglycerate mutase [Thermaurantimonas aggregans]|uniref:2,3-bisphosphoglycerate-independent phosphoglycerate mutase n=1 Tax=Thermaurantimonas aggregans TaxID=2173829 RepID=A0A401XMC5_9FLAO|nr:2,3-bisphosphoglycerate-independent phosphoglycerate mutase [Thermaurantimonas aggregans]MCX8147748.1 2,3-bisphosphoglycerate-independent phosphoglycerate mutase [Thermaurantimonas aggregans]GCD78152.1 2,3-bisphosphoglycerate-independent phosphoglycerate mutase [Thermaurantimonas aggregans]
MSSKVLLCILDGWGIASNPEVSAVDKAHTPFIDSLYKRFPHATLRTSGLDVGLPDGQMGNSEVGHMNLGAGRIVYQDLVKISLAIEDGSLAKNPILNKAFEYLRSKPDKKLHFIGLVSDGGVHSHIDHLIGLLEITSQAGVKNVAVHAFTDGRDTDPKSGVGYIMRLLEVLHKTGGKLASITGRYYAMDRDKRWERIKLAYDALVNGLGEYTDDPIKAIKAQYEAEVTDEFLKPIVVAPSAAEAIRIQPGDLVINFNFRTDRGRQITTVLTQKDFPEYGMHTLPLRYITLTRYDDTYRGVEVLFEKDNLTMTLGEVLEKHGKSQIRIAETEKYPHVTFFFSGGREEPFKGERRILIPSPKVATYDLKPEMSAYEVAEAILPEIESKSTDFICLNFANPDMVGHTGVMEAAIKACEAVDECTRRVVVKALDNGYTCIVLADHGNAEYMINEDGSPNTAHTTNPVPVFLCEPKQRHVIVDGKLGDIAPTILTLMGLPIPEEMTGDVLVKEII